jgi:crossover junction endonuclease MUS81
MFIKIDSREKDLQNKISFLISTIPIFRDLKVINENLPIGDIIISKNNEDILIIERKSINDLLSSIKDGRYEEQSYRLNGSSIHNHNIIYLIEGDLSKLNLFKESKFEKITLYSAIFSLNYYKGFSVIRTFNMDETALFICNCTSKLIKGESINRKPYYSNKNSVTITKIDDTQTNIQQENSEEENTTNESKEDIIDDKQENQDKEYIGLVKRVKKDNITLENIDEIMLCQIPGVSTTTAITIIKKFNTIAKLIKCLEENEKCLNDITYINNKAQTRKITKTSIANIVKFLLKK